MQQQFPQREAWGMCTVDRIDVGDTKMSMAALAGRAEFALPFPMDCHYLHGLKNLIPGVCSSVLKSDTTWHVLCLYFCLQISPNSSLTTPWGQVSGGQITTLSQFISGRSAGRQLSRRFLSVPPRFICPLRWQASGRNCWLRTQCYISSRSQEQRYECHRHSAPFFGKLHLSSSAPQAIPNKPNLLSARQPSNL